ncbi:MAG TPA: hypothetical protein PKY30_22880, partial [Myxococcota bacterium]|nr:hypothetical protein [Myxococcota bacterium]
MRGLNVCCGRATLAAMPHRAHIATLLTDLFTETELRRLLATWYPQWLRNGLAASLNPAQCTHVAVDVLYQHGHLPDPPPPPTLSLFDHLRSERHHQHAKINAVEQKHCCQATKPLYRHPPPSSGLSLSTDLPPPSPYQQLATRAPTTRLHLKIVDGRAALFKDQRVFFSDRSVDYTRLPATPP